jgi:hypothetical protein
MRKPCDFRYRGSRHEYWFATPSQFDPGEAMTERIYRTLDQAYAELMARAQEEPSPRVPDPALQARHASLGDDDDAEGSESGEYLAVR